MAELNRRRLIFGVFMLALTISLTPRLSSTVASKSPQGEGKKLLKKGLHRNPVTEIVNLKVKGMPVGFGEKLNAGDEWLKGLTVNVRNISSKPIIYLELQIELFGGKEDAEATGKPPFVYPLSYGDYHADPSQVPAAQAVAPGGTLNITLTDDEYLSLVSSLSAAAYPLSIAHAQLTVADVIFADGTRWYKGLLLQRNPKNPAKWLRTRDVGKADKRQNEAGRRDPYGAKAAFFLPVIGTSARPLSC
jgi:hypothetical protein